jgi:hypothetical protein
MKALKIFWLNLVRVARQACALPHFIADAGKQRQRRVTADKLEVERLDRICNPSKYRGKDI